MKINWNKKKAIIIVLICILVVILLMMGLYFYGLTSVSKKSDTIVFTVNPGMSTTKVIDNLYHAKVIKSKIASTIYVKFKNPMVQAGIYKLDRKDDTKKIFEILSDGRVLEKDTVRITFVEGKRLLDYVDLISSKMGYEKEEILKVINDSNYLNELINKYEFLDKSILNSDIYYPLEGYLFPATYEFYKDESIKSIIEKMLAKTGNVLDNYNVSLNETPYSIHEILTIASIIENESVGKDADVLYCSGKSNNADAGYIDRYVVSQVIHTRLDINMSLGMDVTTYYGVQKSLKETLTKSDLNSNNAYNTRRTDFIGLPVGPISNPSKASIIAALNPSDTDCVYFYADIKTSKLHFAKTYKEFQNLIQIYG